MKVKTSHKDGGVWYIRAMDVCIAVEEYLWRDVKGEATRWKGGMGNLLSGLEWGEVGRLMPDAS